METQSFEEGTLFDNFGDIPREAVLKEDILIHGLSFTDGALQQSSNYQNKAYFLFTFDKDAPKTVKGRKRIIPAGDQGLARAVGTPSDRDPVQARL